MIPKKSRIERKLFVELLSGSRFVHSPHFTLRIRATGEGLSKVGVSVSKKVAKSAVVRNTVRRRAYDALYPLLSAVPGALLLLVAKAGAQNIKGEALRDEMQILFNEAKSIVLEGKKRYNS